MRKLLLPALLFASMIITYAESIYIEMPVVDGLNKDSGLIVRDMFRNKFAEAGYTIIDTVTEDSMKTLSISIINIDNFDASMTATIKKNGNIVNSCSEIVGRNEDIDIAIQNITEKLNNEETVNIEPQLYKHPLKSFVSRFNMDFGLDAITYATDKKNYNYLFLYMGMGVSYRNDDYLFYLKTPSLFHAMGLRLGGAKLGKFKSLDYYYGGDIGGALFYGTYILSQYNSNLNIMEPIQRVEPYFAPLASATFGLLFFKERTASLRPELRIEASYRNLDNKSYYFASVYAYLTILI